MALTEKHIYDALATVKDPELHRDLVALRMVKGVETDGDDVSVKIELTTPACPLKETIERDVEAAIRSKAETVGAAVGRVGVSFTADVRSAGDRGRGADNPLPDVKHVVAVGAGKGGVGKSTVAVNLAIGLARHGARVGLLDGDIYGPSVKTMLGLDNVPTPKPRGNILLPFEVHGIKAMTIGKLVPPDKALIWRGPMAHNAFKQLATQTDWGQLDYLIVDLPPGTGDVPLTLTQLLPLTGAVVVCTPQKVALEDALRAVKMFQQLGVSVLGMVENMSCFTGDDGKTYDIFGHGGATELAQELDVPMVGEIAIHLKLRVNCDAGDPLANFAADGTLADELDHLCKNVAGQISIRTLSGEYTQPTLSVT